MPDGRNRYTAYERVLFVENADSGKPKGGVNGDLRVHDLIFPHATDIYATLFIIESPQQPVSTSSVCRERDSNPHALSSRRF